MPHEETIREQLGRLGIALGEAEAAQELCCVNCGQAMRPVLRSLDALYEGLCAELAAVRPPLEEGPRV